VSVQHYEKTAASERNIRLIVKTIVTSHTSIAFHVEHTLKARASRRTTVSVYCRVASLAFFEAKFVIFGLFSTPLAYFLFLKKGQMKFGYFWPHGFFMSIWEI